MQCVTVSVCVCVCVHLEGVVGVVGRWGWGRNSNQNFIIGRDQNGSHFQSSYHVVTEHEPLSLTETKDTFSIIFALTLRWGSFFLSVFSFSKGLTQQQLRMKNDSL